MAILVNKMNRDVKVIIPNMREFRVFYSDNEGSVTFFKRDWIEAKEEEQWKPTKEQMAWFKQHFSNFAGYPIMESLYNDLLKLM